MTNPLKSFSAGLNAIILIAAISMIIFHPWTDVHVDSLISWDKLGYYLYLPNMFIYHDWHYFSFINEYFPAYQPSASWYQTILGPDQKQVITYQVGVSFFQLPFFLLGHLSAKLFHYPQDGFSQPYVFWIYLSGLFYTVLGLHFTFKNLRHFFQLKNPWLIVILLILSTNLYYYGFIDNIMPHSYSFFLFAVLLYYTICWHEQPTFKRLFIISLSIGFMISIRSTDIVAIFIPLLYGINSKEIFRKKINWFKNNSGKLIVAILISLIPYFIQMYYWHFSTGYWLYDAYDASFLGFDWTQPHIQKYLTSFRKGWFVYTPVMILSIVGLFFMKNSKLKLLLPGLVLFLLVDLYILSSWKVWWFGGSYGQRSMVQAYAFLVISLTAGMLSLNKIKIIRPILFLFLALCISLNLLFTWSYKNSLILADGMTRAMYKETVLHPASAYIPELKRIDGMQWKDEWISAKELLKADTSIRTLHNGDFSGIMDSKGIEILQMHFKWIRCTFETRIISSYGKFPSNLHIVNEIKKSNGWVRFWKGKLFTDQFGDKNKISEWASRTADFRIPNNIYEKDQYLIYFWQTHDQVVNVRNVKLFGLTLKE